MDANEVLCQLQNVGTDSEAMVVEELACKAGFWWKCKAERKHDIPCNWVNQADDARCANCKSPKP